jgi:hypothetical protein
MPGLALQRLRLLQLPQWPAHKLRHRLKRLDVRFGITTDPLCIWLQTAHHASFIIKSPDRECWMQEHVLGLFYSAAKSTMDNIQGQHTFLIRIADQSLSKLKDRFSRTMNGLC